MSKIAEKRTNEIIGEFHDGDYTDHSRHNTQWVAFKQGYDQAMQDFLERACEWLSKNARNYYSAYATSDKLIEHFKNHMQNESEN